MKLTKTKLKQIIEEELRKALEEDYPDYPEDETWDERDKRLAKERLAQRLAADKEHEEKRMKKFGKTYTKQDVEKMDREREETETTGKKPKRPWEG